jgi:hypothetical protein
MLEKIIMEDKLSETGEITDELDLIWQNNNIELKSKIDEYGNLFTQLDAEQKALEFIKFANDERVKKAIAKVINLRKKLKSRINMLSNNETLRGSIYSFHPFVATHREISDTNILLDSESYLTIEIRKDYWNTLLDCHNKMIDIDSNVKAIEYNTKSIKGKVSELSPNHPAVVTSLEPSIGIT